MVLRTLDMYYSSRQHVERTVKTTIENKPKGGTEHRTEHLFSPIMEVKRCGKEHNNPKGKKGSQQSSQAQDQVPEAADGLSRTLQPLHLQQTKIKCPPERNQLLDYEERRVE